MIVNSTFSGNGAGYGGGVTNNAGSASIYNSTFSGNSASENGGALSTWQASSTPPTTAVHNTIFANSAAPEDCWNGAGSISGGNNVVESPGTGPESCSSITSLELDPGLGTRTGSPSHFPLQAGSPAIDAGNQTVCSAGPVYD